MEIYCVIKAEQNPLPKSQTKRTKEAPSDNEVIISSLQGVIKRPLKDNGPCITCAIKLHPLQSILIFFCLAPEF